MNKFCITLSAVLLVGSCVAKADIQPITYYVKNNTMNNALCADSKYFDSDGSSSDPVYLSTLLIAYSQITVPGETGKILVEKSPFYTGSDGSRFTFMYDIHDNTPDKCILTFANYKQALPSISNCGISSAIFDINHPDHVEACIAKYQCQFDSSTNTVTFGSK